MSSHHVDALKVINSAAVLQLNCRRSHSISNSLFNHNNISNFLFLALQEPPINSYTNWPQEHSGWYLIVTTPHNNLETSRPRSCIYVNSKLNANIQPITSHSRDVSSCVVITQDVQLLLVNV